MTTREDYEHAARAAGLKIQWEHDSSTMPLTLSANKCDVYYWNPEHDDGDSRRLGVACFMQVTPYPIYSEPKHSVLATKKLLPGPDDEVTSIEAIELYGTDPCAATRKAVFRCAVEIGKRLKGKAE